MRREHWLACWMVLAAIVAWGGVGCGSSEQGGRPDQVPLEPGSGVPDNGVPDGTDPQTKEAADAAMSGPARTVHDFLEAARTGDDATATALLTSIARREIARSGLSVAPPASDTARFELGEVKPRGADGAWVASRWTDLDSNGRPKSYEMTWMLCKEAEGWRVAGMATVVFEGEPPLVLNFEKLDEMIAKKRMLKEEIARRTSKAPLRVQQPDHPDDYPDNAVRR